MSAENALAAAPTTTNEVRDSAPIAAEAETDVEIEQKQSIEVVALDSQLTREQAAARIREMKSLPPALRDCLARVALAHAESAADGSIRVPIDAAVRAMEEALPDFLRGARGEAARREHPTGEAFFHGDPAELSDADAEEIARGQLARSGLLRGQKVRAAE